jgi:hypothetical protein
MTTQKRKPIGQRNGLKIYKRLVAKSKLKAKKPINKVSKTQAIKNKCWKKITDEKFEQVNKICLWCGKHGSRTGDNPINGHHIERRNGRNNTIENCYPVHDFECHSTITDKRIDVRIYPNKEVWEKRNENNTNR